MHEMSLVRALLEQVDRVRRDHPRAELTAVRVEVGPLTGVEPLLLRSAFEQATSQRYEAPVELLIDEVPLQAHCEACQQSFEIQDFEFRCRRCRSADVRIVGGDTLQLVNISLRPIDAVLESKT